MVRADVGVPGACAERDARVAKGERDAADARAGEPTEQDQPAGDDEVAPEDLVAREELIPGEPCEPVQGEAGAIVPPDEEAKTIDWRPSPPSLAPPAPGSAVWSDR